MLQIKASEILVCNKINCVSWMTFPLQRCLFINAFEHICHVLLVLLLLWFWMKRNLELAHFWKSDKTQVRKHCSLWREIK